MSAGGPVLSEDAIAALVDAARDGRLPEEKPAPQRRRRMRAVDFTRPTKFTSEQERRLGPHAGGVLPHGVDAPVAPSCACRWSSSC